MTDRDAILGRLGPADLPAEVPGYEGATLSFPDPVAAFRAALDAAGASLVVLPDADALAHARAEAPSDTFVCRGGPAVAESGAVWWVPADTEQRRAAFLAERVALIVARPDLVDDLHSAYRRIDPAAAPYGCFVSGPSKTADIEQALVIGAQGPRALAVWLVG